jgi:hypothetical protein
MLKNLSTVKVTGFKRSSLCSKMKAQSAGDNRVLPALKDNATIETIENNLITSVFKVIINFKPDTLYRVFFIH